ncbi:MAG TPA: response regulator transcription factor [Acidimicrobiales bacterium]|nr:response regulator transcription factor [Acidimicrobiales bacterium]
MEPAPPPELLLVDDDPQLRDLLSLIFAQEGYRTRVAGDAATALSEVSRGGLDLVILDVGLGAGDGREVLAEIRRNGQLPVIMISAHGMPEERILGLRLGADDFLTKPFSPLELVARAETVLRRSRPGIEVPVNGSGGVAVDERTREAIVDGQRVDLTAREFDLLAFLVRSPRQVFSRSQLLEQVWASRSEWQDEATVTEHVRRIRRKIEPDPDRPRWIVTVRGVGYRFEP